MAQYGPTSSWFKRRAICGELLRSSRVWVITSVAADQPTLQVLSERAASSIIRGPDPVAAISIADQGAPLDEFTEQPEGRGDGKPCPVTDLGQCEVGLIWTEGAKDR